MEGGRRTLGCRRGRRVRIDGAQLQSDSTQVAQSEQKSVSRRLAVRRDAAAPLPARDGHSAEARLRLLAA